MEIKFQSEGLPLAEFLPALVFREKQSLPSSDWMRLNHTTEDNLPYSESTNLLVNLIQKNTLTETGRTSDQYQVFGPANLTHNLSHHRPYTKL